MLTFRSFGMQAKPSVEFNTTEANSILTLEAIKTLASSDLKRNIKVQPVFVTLDLQRDTPSPLRAYLKEFDESIISFL
ncbi:protein SCO1, mitochondrial [Artemisia annua]|uniref:Protein SCO1, mitochondrial n=1 Tax=Artemisia annua TaxID=35608 RepID=A0A2U1KZU5_ARTAN|nr:protein SCO1, mitochondrial [Artemisia annua]